MHIAIYITSLFALLYFSLIIYYRNSWLKIPEINCIIKEQNLIQFSVIITARNEEKNIAACIQSILQQNYAEQAFEIIVVDDFSTDNTAKIIEQFTYKNVQLISLKNFVNSPINSYKKKALEIAIAHAKGDVIITTDADCIVPNNWLPCFAQMFLNDVDVAPTVFVAAPVIYTCNNRFLQIFQALDFMTLQGITGASVHKKIHSMCNGANMAYTKKVFNEVGGFAGIDDIASGDDMLLMHKIFLKYPESVKFLKAKEAIVETAPMLTISDFLNQRIRWASKADKYDDKIILMVLFLVYFFNCALFFLPIFSFFTHLKIQILTSWAILLGLKIMVELFFLYPVAQFFGRQKLLVWFPIMQPFHILYTITAGWLGKFGKYNWKGRHVK